MARPAQGQVVVRERKGGRVYALAGGSYRHNALAQLLHERIAPNARAGGCRPCIFDRLLRTRRGNFYYPDLMVVCSPRHPLASCVLEAVTTGDIEISARDGPSTAGSAGARRASDRGGVPAS